MGWNGQPQKRSLAKPVEFRQGFSPHERLLILDTWQRSGLPAGDCARGFAAIELGLTWWMRQGQKNLLV